MDMFRPVNPISVPSLLSAVSTTYATDYAGASNFVAWLNTGDFTDKNSSGLFKTNPSQYILSLRWYPFNPATNGVLPSAQTDVVHIGDATYDPGVLHIFYKSASAGYLNPLYCGCVDLTSLDSRDYRNYSPNAKAQVFLPFYGFSDVDVDQIVGRKVYFYLVPDFDTGKGVYYVCLGNSSSTEESAHDLLMIKECQLGIDLPLGSSNATEKARNGLMTGLTAIAGIGGAVATSLVNPVAGAMMGVGTVMSTVKGAVNASITDFKAGSTSGGTSSLFTPRRPAVRLTRKIADTGYKATIGLPVDVTDTLDVVSAGKYLQIQNVHLEGLPDALSAEIDEIETLLKTGCIR